MEKNTIKMSMASIETMGSIKDIPETNFINRNLISLKCLLFFFFGGIGCIFPFLPLHMRSVGLSLDETRLISIISPIVSIIGPLIAAPIADKLAGHKDKSKSSTGRYLRVMIAMACFLSGLFYFLLTLVPIVERIELPRDHRPTLKFSCNNNGATVLQERNNVFSTCYNWTSDSRVCAILLNNCQYKCHSKLSKYPNKFISTSSSSLSENNNNNEPGVIPLEFKIQQDEIEWRTKLSNNKIKNENNNIKIEYEPPHLCFNKNENTYCQVYTSDSGHMPINASFRQAINAHDKHEMCAYPIAEDIYCRIPKSLEILKYNETCTVECDIFDQFIQPNNHWKKENQCSQIAGDPDMTFWMYIIIRSIADIFPITAFVLIDSAVIIATRETSCGRGDVGRQLAFGSLGFSIFGSISGYLNLWIPTSLSTNSDFLIPIIIHIILMILSGIIALSSNGMPLSPPEWWWHTSSGMLAVPMSAVKRYGSETIALIIILIILGTFWSTMDSYLPLYLSYLNGDSFTIGIVLTIGALPSILFLWKSEHFVDYCGHSNLLIIAFTMYILRFIGLSIITDPWWVIITESLELFTLGIMWITSILYLRHLIPRQFTVISQALPVVAHFCIGRSIGAFVGGYLQNGSNDDVETSKFVYQCMAIAAAIIASIYFIVYHGILKPRCHAQNIPHSRTTPSIIQGTNGNGSYTPLRVYHNGMGRKGQFRY